MISKTAGGRWEDHKREVLDEQQGVVAVALSSVVARGVVHGAWILVVPSAYGGRAVQIDDQVPAHVHCCSFVPCDDASDSVGVGRALEKGKAQ